MWPPAPSCCSKFLWETQKLNIISPTNRGMCFTRGGGMVAGGFPSHHGSVAATSEWKRERYGTWKYQRDAPPPHGLLLCEDITGYYLYTILYKTNKPSLVSIEGSSVLKRSELPGGCRGALWISERAPSTSPHHPQRLTPSRSLYHVQLWSWVTGPLCDTSDPKPIYCLKSLPLSTTPTSTSLCCHTAKLLSVSSRGWQMTFPAINGAQAPRGSRFPFLQPAPSAYRTDSSSWNETAELPSPPPVPPTRAPAYIYVFIKSTWRK